MKKLFKHIRKVANAKRCPHCGTYFPEPELWKTYTNRLFAKKYSLYCPHCHFCGERSHTAKGAIRAWNDDIERLRLEGEVIEK